MANGAKIALPDCASGRAVHLGLALNVDLDRRHLPISIPWLRRIGHDHHLPGGPRHVAEAEPLLLFAELTRQLDYTTWTELTEELRMSKPVRVEPGVKLRDADKMALIPEKFMPITTIAPFKPD